MLTILSINQTLTPAFLPLTYPALRSTLLLAGRDRDVIAFGAQDEGAPVALVLSLRQGETVEVLSLYTVPGHRGRGIAARLVALVEQAARTAGVTVLHLKYMSGRAGDIPLNRLLDAQEWTSPVPRMKFLRARARPLGEAPRWIQQCPLPGEMALFAWHDLEPETAERLRSTHAASPWVPPELDPFVAYPHDPPFDRDTSLGLLCKGELAGWLITHRIAPDVMRYSQWCIRPDLRRGAAAPALLAEAIRRQLTWTDAPWLQLGVYLTNRTMLRFLDRHLDGCFEQTHFSMKRSKQLG